MDEENDESVSSTVKAALARQTWSDCQLAMELDGRHVEAFRMRAKLLQFMAQNGALFPSLCAEVLSLARVESEDVPNSLRNLSMEDSLSAFLLSGCTDFVSASGAEEVAREKCRPQAKEAFQQKVASGSSQFSLPRQWTVRAFFMGHPLLSTALSLDLQSCLFPIPVSQSMTKGSNQIMDGIDDDTTQQPILERPPLHMIDTLLLASANDSSSDEKTDDQVFKVLRPDDCRAFQLLKELVALFDGKNFTFFYYFITLFFKTKRTYTCDIFKGMWLHGPDNKPADESDGADDNDDNEDDESTGNDESDDAATSCFTKSEHMATEDELLSLCGKVLGTNDAGEYDSSSESYLVGCGTANSIDSGRFKSDDTEMDKLADTLVSKTNKLIRASLRTNNRPKSLLPESAPSISTFLDLQMNSAASSGISSKSCDVFVKALTLLSSESTTTLSGVDFRFNTTADYATPVMVGPITPVATLIKGDDKNVVESTDDSDSVWEDVASEDEDDEASEETGDDSASTNEVDKVLTAEQMTTLESRTVSYQLQARLLNVCSSICYLIGDATKAVQCLRLSSQCFRNSIRLSTDCRIPSSHFYIDESGVVSSPLGELIPFDRIATDSASSSLYNAPERNLLLDTYIRLGSLLSDMDEVEEAQDLFKLALKIDPRSASALTHSAENEIQKSNFEGALELLKKAKQVSQSNQITTRLHKLKLATSQLFGDNGQLSSNMPTAQQALVVENIGQQAQQNSLSTIISLLALAQFRESPNSPEVSINYHYQ